MVALKNIFSIRQTISVYVCVYNKHLANSNGKRHTVDLLAWWIVVTNQKKITCIWMPVCAAPVFLLSLFLLLILFFSSMWLWWFSLVHGRAFFSGVEKNVGAQRTEKPNKHALKIEWTKKGIDVIWPVYTYTYTPSATQLAIHWCTHDCHYSGWVVVVCFFFSTLRFFFFFTWKYKFIIFFFFINTNKFLHKKAPSNQMQTMGFPLTANVYICFHIYIELVLHPMSLLLSTQQSAYTF